MGITFTVSVFLQTVRRFSAIKTGVIFTAATVGILVSSLAAARLAKKCPQRTGLLRSISNLGSSLGTAIAGTILVSELATGNKSYVLAMAALAALALIGLVAAILLPANPEQQPSPSQLVEGFNAEGAVAAKVDEPHLRKREDARG